MAHTITRIEGFEWGEGSNVDIMFDGTSGTSHAVIAGAARTGDFGLRITAPAGAGTGSVQLGYAWLATGAQDASTAFVAGIVRLYLRINTLPAASAELFALATAAAVDVVRVDLGAVGNLILDGVSGSSTLAVDQWYRIELKFDSATDATELLVNGTSEITGTNTGAATNRLKLGKATTAGGTGNYIVDLDDVEIEAAASVASIDYPGAGSVLRLDLDGDGFYDGAGNAVTDWTATTDPSAYLSCVHPYNADTNLLISPSDLLAEKQLFTLESTGSAGVSNAAAVQFTLVTRRSTSGSAANMRLITRSGTNDQDLTTSFDPGNSYIISANLRVLSPHTAAAWTVAELDALQSGVSYIASAGRGRCTLACVQVSVGAGASQASSVILTQLDLLTGPLSVTNYSPKVKTIKLTSEALGKPNEAFNVIAVSARYVPWGTGTLRGVWNFDLLSTNAFTIPANPLEFGLLGTAGDSSFIFNQSTMVDGRQVYTYYREIGGSGKVFELYLDQSGSQHWEILALDLEVEPEGRREAYLGGDF